MESYRGEIKLPRSSVTNQVAQRKLIKYVQHTIESNQFDSDDAKAGLQATISMSLERICGANSNGPTGRMSIANFTKPCLIGYGSYGFIWKTTGGKNVGQVALKQLRANPSELMSIYKERDIMIKLKHDRICPLYGAFHEIDIFLVMGLCFASVAKLRNKITDKNTARFAVQLLEAVEWIHQNQVVHADLKPDNCLINDQNNLVVSDFGSAFILKKDQTVVTASSSHGSPGYLDYQANKYLKFSKETDVFAAACIIFEMDKKRPLLMYSGATQTRELYVDALKHGRICSYDSSKSSREINNSQPPLRHPISDRAMASVRFGPLLRQMIATDNRITAFQALHDPFLLKCIQGCGFQSLDQVNNGKEFVTQEYNFDLSREFELLDQSGIIHPEIEVAMAAFYYDFEEDVNNDTDSDNDMSLQVEDGGDDDDDDDEDNDDEDDEDDDEFDTDEDEPEPITKKMKPSIPSDDDENQSTDN